MEILVYIVLLFILGIVILGAVYNDIKTRLDFIEDKELLLYTQIRKIEKNMVDKK